MTPKISKLLDRHFVFYPAGDDNEILPPRKLYTVSLPPEGYIPVSPNTINDPDSESSESNKNTAGKGVHNVIISIIFFPKGILVSR